MNCDIVVVPVLFNSFSCKMVFGQKILRYTSEGFGVGDFKFFSQLLESFSSTLNNIIKKDTEYVAIEDLDLGVDMQCCASPYRLQHCKSLVCLDDPGVDFFVAVARCGDLDTQGSKLLNILCWFAVNQYWVTVSSISRKPLSIWCDNEIAAVEILAGSSNICFFIPDEPLSPRVASCSKQSHGEVHVSI